MKYISHKSHPQNLVLRFSHTRQILPPYNAGMLSAFPIYISTYICRYIYYIQIIVKILERNSSALRDDRSVLLLSFLWSIRKWYNVPFQCKYFFFFNTIGVKLLAFPTTAKQKLLLLLCEWSIWMVSRDMLAFHRASHSVWLFPLCLFSELTPFLVLNTKV